jgi:hypothetical protein
MNTADDRTPAFRAAHDMTDPRNQLPTKAQRQAYSAERLAQAKRDLLKLLNKTRPQPVNRSRFYARLMGTRWLAVTAIALYVSVVIGAGYVIAAVITIAQVVKP